MNYSELILKRQSCRSFDAQKDISEQDKEQILNAVRLAPSARNRQPYRVYALSDGQTFDAVKAACMTAGRNPFLKDSRFALVFVLDKPTVSDRLVEMLTCDFRPIDMGIAISQAVDQAEDIGIGSCIIGWINERMMKKALDLDKNDALGMVVAFGYPTQGYALREKTRKPIDKLVIRK